MWRVQNVENEYLSSQRRTTDGIYIKCIYQYVYLQAGVNGWLFGGAVKNLGSPEHLRQYFQPLKVK